ncbi:DUF4037 domain-containing protein [Nonomuraea pusilla]|uniref:DUF4037 domain-containing protein n=1 Tax=Nonomuraea pusilla TaxID=46177 RepID=A0A1H7IMU5_9ACTN|nr:DUF4037 domain-containing protein [Nonomuraea pusilla]SEK63728.1 protein of unknown function [Nonomuraea pusilla]
MSRAFYREAVAGLVAGVPHSAALIGPGSEVLEFDTARSADHDWGPRVLLFVPEGAVAEVEAVVAAGLPERFRGFPTVFGYHGVRRPGVLVGELGSWLVERLGFDPRGGVSLLDWLSASWQSLAEVTGGEVFHDELGLAAVRETLAWYPRDVWRYVLACQWRRIAQEEPFPGRCGEVGDELGSAVVGARLAREVMRLALLLRRRYPPYAKWLGSALARLPGSAELGESLAAAVAARSWREREEALAAAYGRLAALQNRMGLAEPLDGRVRGFHDRPFRVIGGDRFARALMAAVSDPVVRGLPLVGCADQVSDSVDVLTVPGRARAATLGALGLTV